MALSNIAATSKDIEGLIQPMQKQLYVAYDLMKLLAEQEELPANFASNEVLQLAERERIETIEDAKRYMFQVVPNTLKMVTEIKTHFEIYRDVYTYVGYADDWFDLDTVITLLEDLAIDGQQHTGRTLAESQSMLTTLTKKQDDSKNTVLKLEKEQESSIKQEADLNKKANRKKNVGIGFAVLLPVIGAIPALMLNSSAKTNRREAEYQHQTVRQQGKAVQNISTALQPGLMR